MGCLLCLGPPLVTANIEAVIRGETELVDPNSSACGIWSSSVQSPSARCSLNKSPITEDQRGLRSIDDNNQFLLLGSPSPLSLMCILREMRNGQ